MEIIIARRGEKNEKKNRMNKQHMKKEESKKKTHTQHEISNSLLFYYSH